MGGIADWMLGAFALGLWLPERCASASRTTPARARHLALVLGAGIVALWAAARLGLEAAWLQVPGAAAVMAVGFALIERPCDGAHPGSGEARGWRLPTLVLGALAFTEGVTGGAGSGLRLAVAMIGVVLGWLLVRELLRRRGRLEAARLAAAQGFQVPLGIVLAVFGAWGVADGLGLQ